MDIKILQKENEPILYENLAYWMSELPRKLRGMPINQLAIPGNYNS